MADTDQSQYTVVARRYRPQDFTDLVGQAHISRALGNAIKSNRVGHAYLFTGARGVGKTSSARIFAKCLNCAKGPTDSPCNECDICQAVSAGEDVDVLEIDGASNRGIDEIRQLRSNAGIRPSRCKFKIYIIDEVHMLTQQAFNALLKTLEEPPDHVKFIFCTTDPQKIPITVLSRCQRFDFSPVQPDEITKRLAEIAENEGISADEKALELLARRANGSMRDSQSLLEQLFSFCGENISVEEVHQLLGTADISRIADLAEAMSEKNAAKCLGLISTAVTEGVDTGQLAEQLLGYFRDAMAARVGCDEKAMLSCSASDVPKLTKLAKEFGLETILSTVQVLDSAMVRMQSSVHTRTLLEVAIVRICNFEKLDSISELVAALGSDKGAPSRAAPRPHAKKNEQPGENSVANEARSAPSLARSAPNLASAAPRPASKAAVVPSASPASASVPAPGEAADRPLSSTTNDAPAPVAANSGSETALTSSNVQSIWTRALDEIGDMTADMARECKKVELAGKNAILVTFGDSYDKDMCSRPERKKKIESALQRVSGSNIRIDFVVSPQAVEKAKVVKKPNLSRRQQIRQLHENPFVKQVIETFDAEITGFRQSK